MGKDEIISLSVMAATVLWFAFWLVVVPIGVIWVICHFISKIW